MLLETKQLISKSTIYSIGNVLVKLVAFILIPLYARKLIPAEYGVVALLELVELLGKTVLTFGLTQSILRFLIQYKSKNKEHELFFSNYIFLFFMNIIILGIFYLFPERLVNNLLSLTPENILYFRYVLIVIFSGIFQGIFIIILQAEEKAFHFIAYSLVTFLLLIGLNIYKVAYLNEGVLGIIESKLYVAIVNFIIVNGYFFWRFRPKYSYQVLRESFSYGFPLIFVGISLTLLTVIGRYFLKIFENIEEVGIYSMTYKFGMIINMILITPFRQAFLPLIFRLSTQQDIRKLFRNFLTYFLFIGFLFFLIFSLFARELLIIVTSPQYVRGYIILPLIAFSYLLFGIRIIFVGALSVKKETKIIAFSTVSGAVLNIGLNLLFIPWWGMVGAAVATLMSYLFITITSYIPLQKVYFIQWDWKRAGKIILTGFSLYAISLLVTIENIYFSIIGKAILFLLFPLILYLTNFFYKSELESIKLEFRKITKSNKKWQDDDSFYLS